jgi:hypothetical protein
MPAWRVLLACSLAVTLDLTSAAAQQPSATYLDLSVDGVVRVAAAYVKAYQEQLNYLIADEAYTQQIRSQIPDDRTPKARTMKSELFFMFTPANGDWMAIRDVIEVDRKPVTGRPDLRTALETLPAAQVAGAFKASNSRFNIGRTQRNFNEPILSLLVLDARYLLNFTFERKRVERAASGTLVTLAFTETSAPTLIRDLQLRPVFSKGELVIDAATGRVHRAQLRVTIGGVSFELTTTYTADERLGLWVPAHFRERYEEGMRPPGSARTQLENTRSHEELVCEARYSNYRRFETTARIKKQIRYAGGSEVPVRGSAVPIRSVVRRDSEVPGCLSSGVRCSLRARAKVWKPRKPGTSQPRNPVEQFRTPEPRNPAPEPWNQERISHPPICRNNSRTAVSNCESFPV